MKITKKNNYVSHPTPLREPGAGGKNRGEPGRTGKNRANVDPKKKIPKKGSRPITKKKKKLKEKA